MRTMMGLAATAAALAMAGGAQAASVKVQVHDVASAKGSVRVALCDQASFLKACAKTAMAPAARGTVTVTIPDVAPGRYAVMVFHDENGDRQLNRSPIGVPLEGSGFSRDAMGVRGPPTFEQAAVLVGKTETVVDINLNYF